MLRILKIEWFKIKGLWAFWILLGLFIISFVAMVMASKPYIDFLSEKTSEVQPGISYAMLPIFHFVDLWQNLAWSGRFFLPFLAFPIVLLLSNEFSYGTLKQHIIDGLSIQEHLLGKVALALGISLLAGFLMLLSGFYLGFNFSPDTSFEAISQNFAYIPAYILQVFFYLTFAIALSSLLKKAVLSFGLLLAYTAPLEYILRAMIPNSIEDSVAKFFPIKSMMGFIDNPFPKYALIEVENQINWSLVGIAMLWCIIFWMFTYWNLNRKLS